MYSIENGYISISVASKGAELQSIADLQTGQEYIWDGNPAFWAKHSPVLFPIVGTLKNNTNKLRLNKDLFYKDAIVLKHLKSDRLKVISGKSGKGFEFNFAGFPYLGIWAARDADFVCIEPWCGIADSAHSDQQLTNKEGINVLEAGATFDRQWIFTVLK
ncbi:MAG: hypothetical protein QM640_02700 [Niabella sp.]